MKKFLSLVLALVMTMSLVTISAGAKDFTDDSTINYKEAVDVVSACSILDGYADGSFNPQAGLTRGAAAKIICNLILGPTTASALSADTAPYKDVPADSTFAGYIAYCAQQGIISGYADGTFRPAAPLTGYAFMKMLLGALGYDSTIEGYTGANWSIAVAKQAISIGLEKGNDEFVGTKAVTREEAALYAFNTLKASVVEYASKGINISVGDTTVNTGATKPEVIQQAGSGYANNLNDNPATVQFAEKYFKKLTRTAPGTDFGDPSNLWKYDGKKIGNYAADADLTYTAKVKAKDIYADLGLSAAPTVTYFVDGVATTPIAINKTNDTKYGGQGALTSVYYTSSTNSVVVVVKNTYIGKISSIDEATKTTGRTVNLSAVGTPSANIAAKGATSFETEDFARKDVVLFTAASTDDGTTYAVKSMALAEKVTGELTAYSGSSTVTVAGETYDIAAKAATDGYTYATSTGTLKDIVDLYLDENGNVMDIKTSEAADENYAFVLSAGDDGGVVSDFKAQLLFLDGSKKVVDTDVDYGSTGANLVNNFVTFRVNSDDEYVLKDATAGSSTNGAVAISNSTSGMTLGSATVYGNDATIYLVKTIANNKDVYTVYTGYKNVPTITTAASRTALSDYVCKAGTVANFVFVDASAATTNVVGGTNDVIFVLADGGADLNTNSDSSYYTLKAVINGEIGTINIDVTDTAAVNVLTAGDNARSLIFSGRTVDKYGVSTMGSTTGYSATGIDEISKGTVSVGYSAGSFTSTLALDSSCNVFYVNKSGTILAWDIDSVAYDTNDLVFYTDKNGAVNNLFIVAK